MTLLELTALMSRVGSREPELVRERNVALFIQSASRRRRSVRLTLKSGFPTSIKVQR